MCFASDLSDMKCLHIVFELCSLISLSLLFSLVENHTKTKKNVIRAFFISHFNFFCFLLSCFTRCLFGFGFN